MAAGSVLLRNGSPRKTSSQVTVSFFKILIDLVKIITADWETLTSSGRLDGKFTDSGENIRRRKKVCHVEWEASGYFLRQILLIQRSWSWGNKFALNLEENYIFSRMCFVSKPQSTTVLKSFLKPIVLFSLYIIILSIYQPSDSAIQYPFIEHLLSKVLYMQYKDESHTVPTF